MIEQKNPFLREHYSFFNESRRDWLQGVLPALITDGQLETALDAGAGIGYFSGVLANDFALDVTAFDGRAENVKLGAEEYPNVQFLVDDVEEFRSLAGQSWDLLFCFGLLYHLENPFLAIRKLRAATKRYLLLESRISPGGMGLHLVEEPQSQDQGLRHIANVPSEAALTKMLYSAGFAVVHKADKLPKHPEFSGSLVRRRCRTIMLAETDGQAFSQGRTPEGFTYVPEPPGGQAGFRGRLVTRWLVRARNKFLKPVRL